MHQQMPIDPIGYHQIQHYKDQLDQRTLDLLNWILLLTLDMELMIPNLSIIIISYHIIAGLGAAPNVNDMSYYMFDRRNFVLQYVLCIHGITEISMCH
jgi:hypothetical protein